MRETKDSKGRVRIDEKHSIELKSFINKEDEYGDDIPVIVKSTNDQPIPDDEPRILFRGRDKLAIPMLLYYIELCEIDGCTEFQLKSMKKILKEFSDFAHSSPTMKQPEITKGL